MNPVRQILVATDFGRDSRHAVEYAGRLAKQLGARLVVLHVDEAQAVVPGSDLARRERAADRSEMSRLVATLQGLGVPVSGRVVPGIPEEEIVAIAAELDVDLIVVGTQGRYRLLHVLLGSVAERVLRRAHCPVLTLQAPPAGAPRVVELPAGRAS